MRAYHIHDDSPLVVYPLVRDLFHATRLRQRRKTEEDVFEILRVSDQLGGRGRAMPEEQARLRRLYEPVYSLATLHVIGDPGDKPQSGFCTYFLLLDLEATPTEMRVRLEGNLLGDESPVRSSLLGVLRGLHYLEAERSLGSFVQPVLDPYDWLTPESVGKVGEVVVDPGSRRRAGSIGLSLVALVERVSRVAHALPPSGSAAPRVRR